MKFTVVVVAMLAAAMCCGTAWAAPASSATSASGADTSTDNPTHKRYVKMVSDIQKAFDDLQAQEDKLADLDGKVSDQIHDLKQRDKNGKEVAVTPDAMKKELAGKTPSTAAKKFASLKMQSITARMAIAQKLGPGEGVYGKCQELAKINPKDDTVKAQGDELTQKVKTHYISFLKKIVSLYESISDTNGQDNIYHLVQAVDPNDAVATAYFNKKKAPAGK